MEYKEDVNSRAITVSEAYHLLYSKKDDQRYKNSASKGYFTKTLEYCEDFIKIDNITLVKEINTFLKGLNFIDQEIAILGTIMPSTISEVKILLPSTTRFEDAIIQIAIDKLQECNKV